MVRARRLRVAATTERRPI